MCFVVVYDLKKLDVLLCPRMICVLYILTAAAGESVLPAVVAPTAWARPVAPSGSCTTADNAAVLSKTLDTNWNRWLLLNTLRPRQNDCHFADDTFKCIFLNENVWISIAISLKFVPKGPVDNNPALV